MPPLKHDRDLLLRLIDLKPDDFVGLQRVGPAYDGKYRWMECIAESGGDNRGPHYDKNEAMRQHPLNVADEDIDDNPIGMRFVFETPPELVAHLENGDTEAIEAWLNERVSIDRLEEIPTENLDIIQMAYQIDGRPVPDTVVPGRYCRLVEAMLLTAYHASSDADRRNLMALAEKLPRIAVGNEHTMARMGYLVGYKIDEDFHVSDGHMRGFARKHTLTAQRTNDELLAFLGDVMDVTSDTDIEQARFIGRRVRSFVNPHVHQVRGVMRNGRVEYVRMRR